MTAAAALEPLRDGERIFVGSGCGAPQDLLAALAERGARLFDLEIIHILTAGEAPSARREFLESFRHNAFFIGANVRDAVNEGIADYTPVLLSDVPRLFRERRLALDRALIQVSPPDAHGFCSLGVAVDIVRSAVDAARWVAAEVNPLMPRTLGQAFLHVSEIDEFVLASRPVLEVPLREPSAEALAIAELAATLVDDGATIQAGIGEVPQTILGALASKNDLGMHTEMFTDAILRLFESGALTGARKTLLPGKAVASFCMGTRRLYDFVHDNPRFEFCPVEFTNDPAIIAQNARLTAINSALEADLTGQICAESVGERFHSGFGGLVDFTRGAARSPGGKSIIALPSLTSDGARSRIRASLAAGAGVTVSRAEVHYVVTEYGIADLWGKTVRERSLALIQIAHPKFRDQLLEEARRRKLVHPQQIPLPRGWRPYPRKYETTATFRGRLELRFRPIQPTDEELLREFFYSHSEQTILQRYFTAVRHLSHERLQKLVTLDYANDMAIIGLQRHEGRDRIIAVGRYYRDPATNFAEAAFTIHDELQRRGIGTFLLEYLIRIARENGIEGFTASVLPSNHGMLRVFHKAARNLETRTSGDIYELKFAFEDPKPARPRKKP